MSELVQVEAARIPDRDRLLQLLRDEGLDARAIDEVCLEVRCDDGTSDDTCTEVFASVEAMIMDLGTAFVPIKHDGVIYIRPPLS